MFPWSLDVGAWSFRPLLTECPNPPPPSTSKLTALGREGTAFVLVILTESLGSTPQDTGAKMLVTAAGLHTGTVGGGKVEAKAIALAQEMLADATPTPQFANWALKTDVGHDLRRLG